MSQTDKVELAQLEDVSDPKLQHVGPQLSFELDEHDTKVARRLKWKIDLWTLPMITFVYFLAAMDRSDIGNAQTAGMQKAIGASNSQVRLISTLFCYFFV